MKPVSVIIFDLGKVIVDLSHFEIAAALAEKSKHPRFQTPELLLSEVFDNNEPLTKAFDEGKYSPQEFFEIAKSTFELDISFDDFNMRWNTSFKENVKVTQLIEYLRPRYRLFLLSNTNPLHYNFLKKSIPVLKKMDQTILSYKVGHLKPSPEIYQFALQKAGVSSEQVLFIDDSPLNVQGAKNLGIHGVLFKNAEDLKKKLIQHNIKIHCCPK
ncbi:MAG TPA: HAD family phosphatase [Nitrospiria bacterium]